MLHKLYSWYGRRTVHIVLFLTITLLIGGLFLKGTGEEEAIVETSLPTIRVATAGNLAGGSSINLIGTVKAFSQAQIETEVPGRVVSVRTTLGDTVNAGEVIAVLENNSEQAAVLQAQGVYEGALAAAAQSTVSVEEATNNLQAANDRAGNAVRAAYTTSDDIVNTLADQVFTKDSNERIIGVRLDASGTAVSLVAKRNQLTAMLQTWSEEVNQINRTGDLKTALTQADARTQAVRTLIEDLTALMVDQNPGIFSVSELTSLTAQFQSARADLNAVLANLDTARTSITAATEAVNKARLGGSGNVVSAADAIVKQALGGLRAAQANLEKTILRSPITGTVNALSVDLGDFVSSFTRIAEVANNDALIVTTYVGEADRERLVVGDVVMIEGSVEGTVTAIAPAVDAATKKVEVRIAADSETLKSGDTVSITLKNSGVTQEQITAPLFVPLTAVKFTETAGTVFVVEDNTLVTRPVEVGEVRGAFVEITSGITPTTQIVIDARGRAAGQKVEAILN